MDFPSTHWSLLAKATLNGDTAASGALETFCVRYQGALLRFARHRGVVESEAEDVVQDFLASVSHESVLRRADQSRGRFRSFLLGVFRRHLARYWRDRYAQKRGEAVEKVSIDDCEIASEDEAADEALFDRLWATSLLESAIAEVREEFSAANRADVFEVVLQFLPGSESAPSYAAGAEQLGVSVTNFQTHLHRARGSLREAIRRQIAPTVSAPHEVDEEVAYLGRVLMARAVRPENS